MCLPQNLAWSLERREEALSLGHGVLGFPCLKTLAYEEQSIRESSLMLGAKQNTHTS